MKVKCKCGYEWSTKSKLKFVSCPSCLQKVRIRVIEKMNHPKEDEVYIRDEKKVVTLAEQRKRLLEE